MFLSRHYTVTLHGLSKPRIVDRASPLINIHDIIVSKSFRGLGIGNKLMGEIEKVAHTKKCCKITLEVRQDNAVARSLYEKIGFSRGVPMDFMTKKLLWKTRLKKNTLPGLP